MNPPTHFKTLALVGPTASGKSAISLALAQHFPLEIISMDSALVYTGMDIGTAKPTLEERSQVPHHLIDIRDPASTYSAAEFAADAQRLIQQIHGRGKHALLVGGTMLYLKALLTPLANIPSAQPHIRAELEAQAKALGWPALHAQLALVDAPTAQRLNPNDGQRIGRALEVFRATGRPLSDFHRDPDSPPPEPTLDCPIISLEPMDRAWLHQRIALRFAQMLEQGLIEEVQKLMHRPDLHMDLPSMRCVGYRQVWEVLTQHPTTDNQDAANPIPTFALHPPIQQAIVEKGVAATRQLAKRQLTWLRSMPERVVIACDTGDPCTAVLKQVKSLWSS